MTSSTALKLRDHRQRFAKFGDHLGHVADGRDAHVLIPEASHPFIDAVRSEDGCHRVDNLLLPPPFGELVGDELFAAERAAKIRPELRLQRAYREPAPVSGLIQVVTSVAASQKRGAACSL